MGLERMDAWRPPSLLSQQERAFLFQLGLDSDELEVSCAPGCASFSVVHAFDGGFSWAAFGSDGKCFETGVEESMDLAKQAAIGAQGLWIHRCAIAGTAACPGHCCPRDRK